MFGLGRKHSGQNDERKQRKPTLTENERKIIFIGATIVLVVAAIASLFAQTAINSGGLHSCAGIVLQQQRDSCYSQVALSSKNASVCSSIEGSASRYSCISAVAKATSNISTCSAINSSNGIYSNCILNITLDTGNQAYCSMLDEPLASSCAYSVASQHKFSNLSSCYGIANSTLMRSCIGAYYYDSAVAHQSASYCGSIPNTSNSSTLQAILSQNSNFSDPEQYVVYSSINISPRNYCYYRIATLTLNRSVCGSTTGLLSMLCNDTFVKLNATAGYNLTTSCSSVPGYLQSLCNFGLSTQLALNTSNVTYCTSLQSLSYRYSCISTLAARLGNSSVCGLIPNATISASCASAARSAANATHA